MKTAIVTVRKEPHYRRAAIESGLKRLGYNVVSSGLRPTGKDSLLVTWNLKRGKEEQDATLWDQRGGTVIVMENGYLQKTDKTMYAISVHGHNGSGWFPVGDEDRFTPLGFELKPWRTDKGYTLVCGQRSIGSAAMASPPQWAENYAGKARRAGYEVKLRPHPGNFSPKVPLTDDLRGAKDCVIWSSACGVLALVEGVGVRNHAPHWICEGWVYDREASLREMAHGQWHFNEIATGEPFARMRDADWGPTWR